jgi:signal transduction histidine kinase
MVDPARQQARVDRLGFLSHDLRSPIASILALTESLRLTETAALPADILEQVDNYANRALRSSEQLLHLLRVEALPQIGKSELDLFSVAEAAREQLTFKAREAGVDLVLQCEQPEQVWVCGDGELLECALVNLMDNAINYSASGAHVFVTVSTENDKVACAVSDEGCGIAVADLPNLFTVYGRLRHSPPFASARVGASLGLHLVKTILDRHGGTIDVVSEPGKGSCFTLCLPAVTPSRALQD